jgi:hypothetical protein
MLLAHEAIAASNALRQRTFAASMFGMTRRLGFRTVHRVPGVLGSVVSTMRFRLVARNVVRPSGPQPDGWWLAHDHGVVRE